MKSRRVRRSVTGLEAKLARAPSVKAKAIAHYQLGLFHDNNSREAKAIPHYRSAIALGLPRVVKAEAFAWLASSLYKTGSPDAARRSVRNSLRLAPDSQLCRFLSRLEGRINRNQTRPLTRKARPAKARL
jgi:tetratricopeptide (TPR) repeat protein